MRNQFSKMAAIFMAIALAGSQMTAFADALKYECFVAPDSDKRVH